MIISVKYLIKNIRKNLSDDLLYSSQLKKRTGICSTEGHCYIAAECAFHLLGGKSAGWTAYVLPRSVLGDNTHWWIKNGDGNIVDPTASQFGKQRIPYELGKPTGFLTKEPSKRCRILMNRISAMNIK